MNLRTIIFSKDRPLQLHGTLESFRLRCLESATVPVSVLYRATSPEYVNGYERLKKEFSTELSIDWIEETDFKKNLLDQLIDSDSRKTGLIGRIFGNKVVPKHLFVLFLVDDNLLVQDFSLKTTLATLDRTPDSIGFSLRVGKNTHYCYSNRCQQAFPEFNNAAEGVLSFHWPGCEGDFGYPIEVSSSVYRTQHLLSLLQNLPYTNPNRLEQVLSVSSRLFAKKQPKLLCFDQSVAFCAPLNKVQNILNNRAGSTDEYSSEALNQLFLNGYRIDVEKLKGFTPEAAHQEIELPLIQTGL
jgi:hypothetical protein